MAAVITGVAGVATSSSITSAVAVGGACFSLDVALLEVAVLSSEGVMGFFATFLAAGFLVAAFFRFLGGMVVLLVVSA